jgi:hypothetical protein
MFKDENQYYVLLKMTLGNMYSKYLRIIYKTILRAND